jgi:hypothetical protein
MQDPEISAEGIIIIIIIIIGSCLTIKKYCLMPDLKIPQQYF